MRKLSYILKANTVIGRKKPNSITSPVFALNKGQCYFYHSMAAEGREGDRNSQRDSPRTAVIYRLRALPRESAEITLKWLKLLDLNGGSYGVHGGYIYQRFFVKFSRGSHLFFMLLLSGAALIRVRCNDNDSFSAYHHIFYSVPVCCTPWWGAGCSICWGQRTYAVWQTMLAGYFLDTGGITT